MIIRRKSDLTGIENKMDIDVTEEAIAAWKSTGMLIQDAFPHLNADEREFLLSGATPEEWDAAFPDE